MQYINVAVNALFDLLLWPFRGVSPWPGMIAVACVTAMLFVGAFRTFSDQQALRRQKGRMFARALELLLFRHDMLVSLSAFARMAAANGRYFKELLKPVAVASVPTLLLLIQLACWYDYRPFAVGEPVLVSVDLTDRFPVMNQNVELLASNGLELETEGLRVPALNQMNWRLRARGAGSARIDVQTGDVALRKEVLIGNRLHRISDRRVRAGFWNEVLHPSEPPIPKESPVEQIRVHYPRRQLVVAGIQTPWWLALFVLTMVFGLVFGRLFNVRF